MTTEQMVGLLLALLVMGLGTLGSLLPGIPSTPLVLAGAIGHQIYFGETGAGWLVVGCLGLFTALSLVMDYLASMYGAKKLGATRWGVVGAVVGALIGLFLGFAGVVLGPFVGATLFELAGGREAREAARAGLGATLGLLAGALGKLACCLAMMGLFTVAVLYHTVGR